MYLLINCPTNWYAQGKQPSRTSDKAVNRVQTREIYDDIYGSQNLLRATSGYFELPVKIEREAWGVRALTQKTCITILKALPL